MADAQESILFIFSTPLYVILIALEIIVSNLRRNHFYTRQGFIENMYLMALNTVLDIGMRMVAAVVLSYTFNFHFIRIENPVFYWIVLILMEDVTFWTIHFVDHHVRLFWAVHVTHHSAEEFNLAVGLRSSLFEPLYRFVYFIPMSLLGFKVQDIFFAYSLTQLYGVLIHTRYVGKLGFFEWIMMTPSAHRVHHGSNIKYLDRNMGMFFTIWDRLFGTYVKEDEPVVYGLTKNLQSHDPGTVILHEFRAIVSDVKNAPDARSKWMYVFGPPGWSHDGSRKTSAQLRRETGIQ